MCSIFVNPVFLNSKQFLQTSSHPNKRTVLVNYLNACSHFSVLHSSWEDLKDYNIKNRLHKSLPFWSKIGAPSSVLDIISHGYSLPFSTYSYPPQSFFKNNTSALRESQFVHLSILELIKNGCIELCPQPAVVNPLSVSVQSNNKLRLILDLRYVNQFLTTEHFKLEDYRTVEQFLIPGGFLFSFDLKKGYHHIGIREDSRKWLAFSWKFGDTECTFCFKVLPFSLSSAPFIFTKILRPLVSFLAATRNSTFSLLR